MEPPRLHVFGAPRLEPGGPTITLPTPLAALAAYLAVHGRVARWRLAGAIWPDLSEAQARRMLSTALYRLRRALGEAAHCLRTDGEWVSLDGLACDIAEFRAHAASDEPDRWRLALDLYAAEILPDYDTDWLDALRSDLHLGYLGLLERTVAEQTRGGDVQAALELAQRWASADPLNETAHMALMRLYGRLGRYTAALQQFAQLGVLLDKELGIAPLPETSALAEQLRRELEIAQSRAAIERQQQGRQPYVGRSAERAAALEALDAALAGRAGLLLIEGEAGQGKSRLLDELAAAGLWRGFQVAWGRAGGRSAGTPYAPLDQALTAAAAPPRDAALRQQLSPVALQALGGLVPHLRSGEDGLSRPSLPAAISEGLNLLSAQAPLLLLLDDVQWASPAFWAACAFTAGQTAALARCPLLIVLAYRPWPDQAAALERFASQWRASRLSLRGLSHDEVQQLVAQSGDRPGRELSADELAALVAITDGNPLYVQESLAGERREPQPFRQIIAERMAGLGAAALDALYAAAVLGREWPAALWQDLAEQPIAELAAELEAARLIQAAGAGYAFRHDLIHQHVAAAIPAERERVLHGRAVERLNAAGAGPERLGWHAERAGDSGAAIGWYRAAAEAALAAFAYSTALDHVERALALLEQASPDPAARLALLCVRQRALGVVGRIAGWRADVDAIERLALELDHPPARLEALEARIALLSVDSQVEPMRAVAEEAARLAESLGQLNAQSRIWRAYAFHVILAAASPPADTLPMLQRSVTLAEREGDAATQVASLCTLAFAECMMGRTGQAHSHAAQALTLIELYPELYPARGDVLRVLAEAALNRADWATARATMHKAIDLLEEQDDKWTLGAALFMAVYVFGGMGQHAEARAAVDRLHDLLRFADIDPYSNWSLYTYTVAIDCALQAGDLAAAEAVVQRHRAWLDGAPKSGAALYLLTEVGALRLFQNRPREALEYLRQALPLWFAARSGFLPLLLTHALAAQVAGESAEAARSMSVAEEHYASHEIAYCAVLFHFTRFWVRGSADDLQAAHQAMHAQAERIRDQAQRQAFLEEVRLHKMVALLWRVRPLAATLRSLAGLWLRITQVYAPAPAAAGTIQAMLARADAPLGKALGADERVSVRWTLHAPEDDLIGDKGGLRQQRLRRLLREAAEQGGAPTDDDLARALQVSRRTILRDMAALAAEGELPPTRRRK